MDADVSNAKVNESKDKLKAVVVGGGPAGVLFSMKLLLKGFQVDLIEKYSSISSVVHGPNSFYYALDGKAIRAFDCVGAKLPEYLTVLLKGTVIHSKNGRESRFLPYPSDSEVYSISRDDLLLWMYSNLCSVKFECLNLMTGWSFQEFENDGNVACFRSSNCQISKSNQHQDSDSMKISDYSLFIGADGVNSKVRDELIKLEVRKSKSDRLSVTQKENNQHFKVLPVLKNSSSVSSLIGPHPVSGHIFSSESSEASIICMPIPNGNYSCIISSPQNALYNLHTIKTASDAKEFFKDHFPSFYKLFNELGPCAFEHIAKASVGRGGTSTYCSRFNSGKILLIGDAAHSMCRTIGQGCNTALDDTYVLGKVLDEVECIEEMNIKRALKKYNRMRVEDVHAIVRLSENIPLTVTKKKNACSWYLNFKFSHFMSSLTKKMIPWITRPRVHISFDNASYLEIKKMRNGDWKEAVLIVVFAVACMFISMYIFYA